MKNILIRFFVLLFFCGFVMISHAQTCTSTQCTAPKKGKTGKTTEKTLTPREYYYDGSDDENEWKKRDVTWKQNGFEFFFGGGIYFAGKKTANYYNGAPENSIRLNLLSKNEYLSNQVLEVMKRAYPYITTIEFSEKVGYNYNAGYSIAMDIALGARYRFNKNWFLELSYSFRRLSVENKYFYDFPGVLESEVERPYYSKHYSRWQYLLAKEDRHYIDFSVGYILQVHNIAKPFISLGGTFTYIRINKFIAVIEDQPFDLMQVARYPNWTPGVQEMPNYRDWAGLGYGASLTVGLKIAFNHLVSIDPIFQLSLASFGNNNHNLPNFNTKLGFNYMAGIRLVMNDALFTRNK